MVFFSYNISFFEAVETVHSNHPNFPSGMGQQKMLSRASVSLVNSLKIRLSFLSDSGTTVLPGFKNGCFDFHEGHALTTHQVMPLTSQSVAYHLLMSHFRIASERLEPQPNRYQKTTW